VRRRRSIRANALGLIRELIQLGDQQRGDSRSFVRRQIIAVQKADEVIHIGLTKNQSRLALGKPAASDDCFSLRDASVRLR
jgi:hypothetical protein